MVNLNYAINTLSTGVGIIISGYLFYLYYVLKQRKYFLVALDVTVFVILALNNSLLYIFNFDDLKSLYIVMNHIFAMLSIIFIYLGPLAIESSFPTSEQKRCIPWLVFSVFSLFLYIFLQIFNPEASRIIYTIQIIPLIRNFIRCIYIRKKYKPEFGTFRWAVILFLIITFIFFPLKVIVDIPSPLRDSLFPNMPYWIRITPIQLLCSFVPLYIFISKNFTSRKSLFVDKNNKWIDKYNLTKREISILPLLLDGKKYKDISKSLNIEVTTVKFHIKNIYEKSLTNNRIELIKSFDDLE